MCNCKQVAGFGSLLLSVLGKTSQALARKTLRATRHAPELQHTRYLTRKTRLWTATQPVQVGWFHPFGFALINRNQFVSHKFERFIDNVSTCDWSQWNFGFEPKQLHRKAIEGYVQKSSLKIYTTHSNPSLWLAEPKFESSTSTE